MNRAFLKLLYTEEIYRINERGSNQNLSIDRQNREICIIVPENNYPKTLLDKILKALKTDPKKVLVTTSDKFAVELVKGFALVISFDPTLSVNDSTSQKDLYKAFQIKGSTYVISDTLQELEANVALKKELWQCLKGIIA